MTTSKQTKWVNVHMAFSALALGLRWRLNYWGFWVCGNKKKKKPGMKENVHPVNLDFQISVAWLFWSNCISIKTQQWFCRTLSIWYPMDTNAYICMCTHITIQSQEKPIDKTAYLFIYYSIMTRSIHFSQIDWVWQLNTRKSHKVISWFLAQRLLKPELNGTGSLQCHRIRSNLCEERYWF